MCVCVFSSDLILKAESPDEVALVLAASEHGNVTLVERNNSQIYIKGLDPAEPEYIDKLTLLAVNEFESDRKRMSVIVRSEKDGRILLLCKGADSSMMERCLHGAYNGFCDSQINKFASTGLRTLAFGNL